MPELEIESAAEHFCRLGEYVDVEVIYQNIDSPQIIFNPLKIELLIPEKRDDEDDSEYMMRAGNMAILAKALTRAMTQSEYSKAEIAKAFIDNFRDSQREYENNGEA